jgi:hypothetical protein
MIVACTSGKAEAKRQKILPEVSRRVTLSEEWCFDGGVKFDPAFAFFSRALRILIRDCLNYEWLDTTK